MTARATAVKRRYAVVFILCCLTLAGCTAPPSEGVSAEFDFIIVGGGTAGCVVAGRLAERQDWSVLVLEAGPLDVPARPVPGRFLEVLLGEATHETHVSVAQKSLGSRTSRIIWGRGIGGSAAHNLQGMVRGSPRDYEAWNTLLGGGTDWNWATALEAFKRAEFFDGAAADPALRGTDPSHPFPISEVRYRDPVSVAFHEAARASGFPPNPDYNGASMDGVAWMQVNTRDGRRVTTYEAYLEPVRHQDNVTIVDQAFVTRIDFDRQADVPRAAGVRYVRNGIERRAALEPGGEVLLAASTFNSPKILMLSGVGPREHLEELGIDVVHDAPSVGRGLHDHARAAVGFRARRITAPKLLASRDEELAAQLTADWERGEGPLTTTGYEVTLFFKSPHANAVHPVREDPADVPPDLEVWPSTVHMQTPASVDRATLDPSTMPLFTMLLLYNTPGARATGYVRLSSADPTAPVEWDSVLLNDPREVQAIAYGIERAREVARRMVYPGTQETVVVEELWPGAELHGEALERWVAENADSGYHPVGSCAMGKGPDACVDLRLRVNGVRGVRVVDGSVMPRVPRGNTTLPIIMVAERAAELIREDHPR